MNYRFLFALFAIAAPLVAGSYGPVGYGPHASSGIDELVNAASGNPQVAQTITGNAEAQPTAAEAARLGQVSSQIGTLHANPTYNNLRNSDSIAESLAQSNLATNIRQGNVNIVSPNVVDQDIHRSLLVPSGPNNHQVIATQPLPPIVVTQPGAPPAQVSSGPAAVVKAAPVIYKIKPSVIFQQEVINKVPTPLSLNPVYVKVYKPGQQITAPVAPVLQQSHGHGHGHGAHGVGVAGVSDAGVAGVSGVGVGVGAGAYGNAGPSLGYVSQAAPAYGNPAASAYGNPGASVYGNPAASAYGNPAASAYDNQAASAYGNQAVSAYGNPAASAYASPVAPAYANQAVAPAYPQANY